MYFMKKTTKKRRMMAMCVSLAVAMLLVDVAYSQDKNGTDVKVVTLDSVVIENIIRSDVLRVLSDVNAVIEYNVVSSGEKTLTLPMDEYWVREGKGRRLTDDEVSILYSQIVNNPRNYSKSFAYISNPYIPEKEYSIIDKNGDSVEVRISPSDKTWTILHKGKSIFHNRFIADVVVNFSRN
ncbi:MAG: hypothetical protein AUK63_14 [bacterium P3]|nr:MAG: hypothetical protein AUK63_14 [bacterium P3]